WSWIRERSFCDAYGRPRTDRPESLFCHLPPPRSPRRPLPRRVHDDHAALPRVGRRLVLSGTGVPVWRARQRPHLPTGPGRQPASPVRPAHGFCDRLRGRGRGREPSLADRLAHPARPHRPLNRIHSGATVFGCPRSPPRPGPVNYAPTSTTPLPRWTRVGHKGSAAPGSSCPPVPARPSSVSRPLAASAVAPSCSCPTPPFRRSGSRTGRPSTVQVPPEPIVGWATTSTYSRTSPWRSSTPMPRPTKRAVRPPPSGTGCTSTAVLWWKPCTTQSRSHSCSTSVTT